MFNKLLFILLLIPCVLFGQLQGVVMMPPVGGSTGGSGDADFIAQFLFENDLTDEKDNWDGTAQGTLTYSTDSHSGTYSLDINSSTEGVVVGAVDFGSAFSITYWHKYANASNSAAFVHFANRTSTSNSDGFSGWLNGWADTDGDLRLYTGDGSNQDLAYTADGTYTNSAWNFIAWVWDGSAWTVYIDGDNETASGTTQDDFATSGNMFMIGCYNSYNYAGQGLYDDFRIYIRELSQSDITTIYSE